MTGSFRYDERKSGLVRQLSAFDVFLINTFGYALGVAVTINPVFIGGFAPSSNIYLVLALGLAAALSNGFTYGLFSAMMPKTGGDYVYVTRTLGPLIGFIASVGFTIAQIYGLSLDSTWAITQALSPSLTTYGMVTGNPRLIGISSFLTDNTHALFISVGFMLLLLFVSFLGLRFTKRLFIVVFAFAMLGTVLQAYAFFSVDQGQFRSLFDNFMRSVHMNTISYADVISIGQKGGMGFDRTRMLAESFRALPLGFLMFLGFTYSVYMGSEVKEAGRSQLVGIFSALLVGASFFFLVIGRYIHVVGPEFNAALAANDVATKLPAGTSLTFFAGIILQNRWLNLLMNLGNFLWFALVPLVIVQVCSRNVQVWAIDYLLPERFTRINRNGCPYLAGWLTVAIGIVLSLVCYWRNNYAPVGAVAVVAVSILLSGVSALLYPMLHRQEFEHAPNPVRQEWFGVPVLQIAGGASIVFFAWILYAAVKYPEIRGTESSASLYLVFCVYAITALYFLWKQRNLRRELAKEGMDIEEIWGSLPKD